MKRKRVKTEKSHRTKSMQDVKYVKKIEELLAENPGKARLNFSRTELYPWTRPSNIFRWQ
jgi:hypothetical protein